MPLKVGLISVLIFLVSCRTSTDQTFSKSISEDSTIILRSYGLQHTHYEEQVAVNLFSKKYGVRYETVAGCVVTEQFADSINFLNKKAEELLIKRNGKVWEETFHSQVDSLDSCLHRAEYIAGKEDYFKTKKEQIKETCKNAEYPCFELSCFVEPLPIKNLYFVEPYAFDSEYRSSNVFIYYKMLVDLDKETVKLIDDAIDTCVFKEKYPY
jgi:hypothetical protein